MNVLFSLCSTAAPLLPHFFRYYKAMGASQFHCLLYPGVDTRDRDYDPGIETVTLRALYAAADAVDIRVRLTLFRDMPPPAVDEDPEVLGLNYLRRVFVKNGWYCVVDLDEFVWHQGKKLHELAALAEAAGCGAINGQLIDRIASDFSLPEVRPDDSLDDKFPLASDITKSTDSCPNKCPLARCDVSITPGHHFADIKKFDLPDLVHHFKWTSGLTSRLARRCKILEECSVPWVKEPKLQMEMVQDGKLCFDGYPNINIRAATRIGA